MRALIREPVRVSDVEAFAKFEQERTTAVLRSVILQRDWFAKYAADLSDAVLDKWALENKTQIDAVWETDTAVADFRLKNPGKYDIAFTVPGDFKYGIYFGKGKTDVGTALTAALKALKDDGTLAALATKYNLDPANLDVIQ